MAMSKTLISKSTPVPLLNLRTHNRQTVGDLSEEDFSDGDLVRTLDLVEAILFKPIQGIS